MDNNKETKSSIKDIVKFLTKGIAFCVILAVIMYIISPIFTPKWYNNMHGGATRRVKGIYTEPKDTIDIVGIGSSDLYASGVSTMKLWNDMGTTTYHIGISKQTTWTAYYMLKDFYKRQCPKLAIINMDFCFETGDGYKQYIREGMDNMPMSINKLEMINDPVFKNSLKAKISFVFPVIRFHSRWSELTKEELKQAYTNDNVPFKGYELNKKIDETKAELVFINSKGEAFINDKILDIIDFIKNKGVSVRLLSNGYLLGREEFIKIANKCDEIVGEIKVITEEDFQKIQRPIDGYTLEKYINNMISFNKQYKGRFIFEVTIIKGYNDDEESVKKLKEVIKQISPDKIIVARMDDDIFKKKLGISDEKFREISQELLKK